VGLTDGEAAADLQARRFDAAGGGRRWQGVQTFGNINSEIGAAAGPVLRRAAYYCRNNPWISNGINAIVANAVGPGIKPQSLHPDEAVRDVLHARWDRWLEVADADGVTDGYGLQALGVRTMVEAGECFAHLLPTQAGLRVRLYDPEMVPRDETRELGDGRRILQGIELDPDGMRAAFWVHRTRPEVPAFSTELVRVSADAMAHCFLPLAPGQLRGISWLAPVLLRLHEIDLTEDAHLVRQKVAALLCAFLIDPTGTANVFQGTNVQGVLSTGMEPGTLKALPPGTDVKFSDPAELGDAIQFLKLQLGSVAAGLGIGVPTYLLDNDVSAANYSSLRAALLEFRARLEQLQHSVIVHMLCRPIWRMWVLTEVLAGRIAGDLDALLAVEWITPRQPWVDPENDSKAIALQLGLGLTSRRREVAALGWNVEQLNREIARDPINVEIMAAARARSLGSVSGDGAPTPSSAQASRPLPPNTTVRHAA